jgi:hypothetical protein
MGQSGERKWRRDEQPKEQPPASAQTPEASRAAIEDLIAIWPDNPVVTTAIMDGTVARAASIWVFAEHAVRTAQAILVLDEQRMYMQCAPLARLVVECGVTAAWAAREPMSGHKLSKGAKRHHDNLMRGMAEMSGIPVPEEDADANAGLEGVHEQPTFRQRADSLDGGVWINRFYQLLSGVSHGLGPLVQEYLEEAPADHAYGHRFQLRDPEQFPHRYVVLILTAVALNFALLSWDEVSEGHWLRQDLDRVGRKHHLESSRPFDHDDPVKTAQTED